MKHSFFLICFLILTTYLFGQSLTQKQRNEIQSNVNDLDTIQQGQEKYIYLSDYDADKHKQINQTRDVKDLIQKKGIFKIYRDSGLSIRGIAKETKISSVNIFHTLKKSKKAMRDLFGEDYEDYLNGEYDLID